MKRILLLSLLLLPIVALAQYPTFSNKQKLGVQTTGDGLIFRGNNNPNYNPSNINNAYFYLDTTTSKLYLYSVGTWQQIYPTASDTLSLGAYLLKSDTLSMLLPYLRKSDTISLSNRINNKLNATDTVSLSNRINLKLNKTDTINLSNRIDLKLNKSDTISLSNRINIKLNPSDTVSLSNRINTKLNSNDTINLSNRINKKLDTLYVNYQTNVDLLTNKDTINISPLEAGAGINITNNVISLDTTLLDSVVRVQNVYVQNDENNALSKGEAVYVTGANGTNILVKRASNIAESSSSKTLGLTMTSIPSKGFGYVIKEGLLEGLNTSAADSAGVPIWLGVNGTLIYGLNNKPYAPNHLVYLGVVTRKHQNNGEIYVTVQNGFEIKELHDVQIIDPVNKASLYYNSSQSLWRDTTAALLVSDTVSMLNPYLRKLDTLSLSNRIDRKFNTLDTAILGYVTTYSNQLNINGNKTFNNTVSVDSLNSTKQAKIQTLTVGKGGYITVGGGSGGISSTAFGFEALKNNTIGDWNTAIGYQSLLSNTTAWNNVAIGNNALKYNTTGEYNTAIGTDVLDLNIVGNYNTAIGYNSGSGSKGSNNIFIGYNTSHTTDSINNILMIGGVNTPLLSGILSGNKKLGVNVNPLNLTNTFEVNSPISNAVKINSNTNSTNLELANNSGSSVFIKSSNRNMILQTDTTALMYLNGDNKKVGILTMNPQQELEVNGNVRIDSLDNNIIPTRMVGSNNNGDLTDVNLGEGLSFVGDTLKVDLTIIDTAIAASSITLIGNVTGSGSTNSPVTTTIGNGVVTNNMLAGSISDTKLNTITTSGKISNTAFASQTANTVLAAPNGSIGTPTFRLLTSTDIPNLNYLPLTGGIVTGNTSFSQRLTVGSSTNYDVLNVHHTSEDGFRMSYKSEPTNYFFQIRPNVAPSNVRYVFSQTNLGTFYDSVIVLNQGNIGINKLNPAYKLDVNGQIGSTGFVKSGGLITQFLKADGSVDANTYLTTASASSIYQTKLTNPITGTGTINYISKFTGASTLGNSLINDNGNYIGINKPIPDVGIDLINNISATSAKIRLQTNFQTAIRTLELGSGDGLSWDLPGSTSQSPYIKVIGGDQSVGGGALNLMTNDISRLFIRKDGNIGVGLTNPSFKLDVSGTLGVTGATSLSSTLGVTGATTLNNILTINSGAVNSLSINNTVLNNSLSMYSTNNGSFTRSEYKNGSTGNTASDGLNVGYYNGGYFVNYENTKSYLYTNNNTNQLVLDTDGNVGIGIDDATAKLDVSGTLKVSGTTTLSNLGTNGTRMVVTDNNGLLSTQAIPSSGSGTVTNVSAGSPANGLSVATPTTTPVISIALANGTTSSGVVSTGTQVFGGSKTFSSNLIVNTISVGKGNNSLAGNTVVGLNALSSTTTGTYNTAVGEVSLRDNLIGEYNTALGSNSLTFNTTGSYNTAIGQASLYRNNANHNTAVGESAAEFTIGSGNTAVGSQAMYDLTTGTDNTIIGYDSNASTVSATNQIVIGSGVVGQANNTVTIGSISGKIYNNYTTNATWTQTSDGRLKNIIAKDSLGLSFINRLNPITYTWKPSNDLPIDNPYYNAINNKDTTTVIHGFVAQEIKAALDAENCSTFNGWVKGDDGIEGISREMFINPLVKAIQELSAQIEILKAEIKELKKQ